MKRRDMLKLSATTLLGMGLWPGRLRAQDSGKGESGWTFLAVNDLHFAEPAVCGPWFEKVVLAMKASAPDAEFCLLGGDQANDGKRNQIAGVRDVFQGLRISVYATPGNHDYSDDGSRNDYDQLFPGQLNQMFEHRGWQVIGLDSTEGTKYINTNIQPGTFAWLDQNLPKFDASKPTILWTHFPLGPSAKYRPGNSNDLLERFRDFNVQAAFSGHWHGFTEATWRNALMTTNRCCARVRGNHGKTKEKGWFVCRVKDGRVTREFVQIPEDLRG